MVTRGDVPAEFRRAAHLDGVHHPLLVHREPMGGAITHPLGAEDVSELECRRRGGALRRRGHHDLRVGLGVLQEIQR